jgi:hypothetical protein
MPIFVRITARRVVSPTGSVTLNCLSVSGEHGARHRGASMRGRAGAPAATVGRAPCLHAGHRKRRGRRCAARSGRGRRALCRQVLRPSGDGGGVGGLTDRRVRVRSAGGPAGPRRARRPPGADQLPPHPASGGARDGSVTAAGLASATPDSASAPNPIWLTSSHRADLSRVGRTAATTLAVASRRRLQNRVRPPQLTILTLQLSQPDALIGGRARPVAGVDLGLLHQSRNVSGLIPSCSPTRRNTFLPSWPGRPCRRARAGSLVPAARRGTSSGRPSRRAPPGLMASINPGAGQSERSLSRSRMRGGVAAGFSGWRARWAGSRCRLAAAGEPRSAGTRSGRRRRRRRQAPRSRRTRRS